jgi:hypothetical protein
MALYKNHTPATPLSGSTTGPAGSGRSDQRFVSNSGRVVIEPEDWDVEYVLSLPNIKPLPSNFTVRWQVVPYYLDAVTPAASQDPSIETSGTVAQGLSNQNHVLEILGSGKPPLAAVRVYCPPRRPLALTER